MANGCCVYCNRTHYSNAIHCLVICGSCCSGVKSVFTTLQKFNDDSTINGPAGLNLVEALKCLEAMKVREKQLEDQKESLEEKSSFLAEYGCAYRNQSHCDIQLRPGDNGPSIPAHKSLLTTRSDIFRMMLDSDGCKASVPSETITLAEMSYTELDSLLEFLYSGDLPKEKVEKNVYALTRAAHKYKIPYLQTYCEKQMTRSMNSSNVLDVLKLSDTCCNQDLKETALNFIVKHMKEITVLETFEAFAVKNPQLSVDIIRAMANQ